MNRTALDAFNEFQKKGRPRNPSRPFVPQAGATPADYREYADKLENYEKLVNQQKLDLIAYESERAKLHDAVTESMLAEYSNSGIKPAALSYILTHAIRETRTLEEADNTYEVLVQLFLDVDKLNKGEILY